MGLFCTINVIMRMLLRTRHTRPPFNAHALKVRSHKASMIDLGHQYQLLHRI